MIDEFKQYMVDYIDSLNMQEHLKKAMKYALISDGKLVRPLVFFHLLESFNINYKQYYNVAAAIEMVHTYSLVHDDLPAMDDDDYRRGRLTVHKKFDEAIAILCGDALLTQAFHLISLSTIKSSSIVEILKSFVECCGVNNGMINGQVIDMYESNKTEDELYNLHYQKTARLIELPMLCALIIADVDEHKTLIKKLSKLCGTVYQIQDDYLDMYGEDIGKEIGSDLRNNKITFATLYDKNELIELINNKNLEINNLLKQLNLNDNFNELILSFGKREK